MYYTFDSVPEIKNFAIELRAVMGSYDYFPKDYNSDDIQKVIKFKDITPEVIAEFIKEKIEATNLSPKCTVDVVCRYNFKDNVSYKNIKKFSITLFNCYNTLTKIISPSGSMVARGLYIDGQTDKKVQNILNEDVFKFIFSTILKKEFGLTKINKEAKQIIDEFSSAKTKWDVPTMFNYMLKNNFRGRGGALNSTIRYNSPAMVTLVEDKENNTLKLTFGKDGDVSIANIKSMCFYINHYIRLYHNP